MRNLRFACDYVPFTDEVYEDERIGLYINVSSGGTYYEINPDDIVAISNTYENQSSDGTYCFISIRSNNRLSSYALQVNHSKEEVEKLIFDSKYPDSLKEMLNGSDQDS